MAKARVQKSAKTTFGKSNENDPLVRIEIRAAALVAGARSRKMERYGMTVHGIDCEGIRDEEPVYPARDRADIDAGWLCSEIREHSDSQVAIDAQLPTDTSIEDAAPLKEDQASSIDSAPPLDEAAAPIASDTPLDEEAAPLDSAPSLDEAAAPLDSAPSLDEAAAPLNSATPLNEDAAPLEDNASPLNSAAASGASDGKGSNTIGNNAERISANGPKIDDQFDDGGEL